jgi:hypothetical protein
VWVSGDSANEILERLRGSTRDLLGELDIDTRWGSRGSFSPPMLLRELPQTAAQVVAFVFVSNERAVLYCANDERVTTREVRLHGTLDEIGREEIAHILADSVHGLLHGARIGVTHEEAARSIRAAAPARDDPTGGDSAPENRRVLTSTLSAFYEAEPWEIRTMTHGPGLSAGLATAGPSSRFGAGMGAQFRMPVEVQGAGSAATIRGGSLSLYATWESRLGGATSLSLSIGPNLELNHLSPYGTSSNVVELAPKRWIFDPEVRVSARIAYRLADRLHLGAHIGCDIDMANTRYTIEHDGVVEIVLEAWPVRPFLSLSLGVDLGETL